jgi:hypothetical protein
MRQQPHQRRAEEPEHVEAEDGSDCGLAQKIRGREQAERAVVVDGDERAEHDSRFDEQRPNDGIAQVRFVRADQCRHRQ